MHVFNQVKSVLAELRLRDLIISLMEEIICSDHAYSKRPLPEIVTMYYAPEQNLC